MHNNSVMWSEENLPGKQFFDILRFIFWLMRFYVFILARSIASSFGQNLLCKAQKARIDFKADKFEMQPCSLKAFKESIFGRNSFNFLKRRQFVTRTLSGVSSLLTYFLMPLFLVDNGRNDCVDSMVNDVESLISIHRKRRAHNKLRRSEGWNVVIDMWRSDGILMKLTTMICRSRVISSISCTRKKEPRMITTAVNCSLVFLDRQARRSIIPSGSRKTALVTTPTRKSKLN